MLNPPIAVGTGFKNCRPAFFARRNIVMSLRYHIGRNTTRQSPKSIVNLPSRFPYIHMSGMLLPVLKLL